MVVRVPLVVCLAALLAILPALAGADGLPDAAQPIAASALITPTSVLVSWLPGAMPVSGFEVYGIQDGTPVALASVGPTETSAPAPTGYTTYAVSAWYDGTQTQATQAVVELTDPCVAIYPGTPPGVAVAPASCLPQ